MISEEELGASNALDDFQERCREWCILKEVIHRLNYPITCRHINITRPCSRPT